MTHTAYIEAEQVKQSDYPSDFVPRGGVVFVGVDRASGDSECTVKGFYKDGEYHVQSIEYGDRK